MRPLPLAQHALIASACEVSVLTSSQQQSEQRLHATQTAC